MKKVNGALIEGDVDVQRDFVGRDQIIQNIIVVGRVLDFAQIEELLPSDGKMNDFQNIENALATIIDKNSDEFALEAVAFAGEILREPFRQWKDQPQFNPIPFRELLPALAPHISSKLKDAKYWQNFTEGYYKLFLGDEGTCLIQPVLFLESLSSIWNKKNKSNLYIGIADVEHKAGLLKKRTQGFVSCRARNCTDRDDFEKMETVIEVNFENMGHDELRIFILGIVIDLIRMASIARKDNRFWAQLSSILEVPNQAK